MRLVRQLLTRNDCFVRGRAMIPKGVMVHSTGANNPGVSRYVPGDEVMGRNSGGNHWDQSNEMWQEKFGRPLNKCVHAFIGRFADGGVGTVQTLPWDRVGWHAGGGANGSHIGFEICEDGLEDADYFHAVWEEAAELTAMLCERYGLDPMADGVVICHAEGYARGIASNHGDILHWIARHGRTMDDFRAAVLRHMRGGTEMTQERFDTLMEDWLARQEKKTASPWAAVLMDEAKKAGITDGTRPQSFATRQEVALMIRAALRE